MQTVFKAGDLMAEKNNNKFAKDNYNKFYKKKNKEQFYKKKNNHNKQHKNNKKTFLFFKKRFFNMYGGMYERLYNGNWTAD